MDLVDRHGSSAKAAQSSQSVILIIWKLTDCYFSPFISSTSSFTLDDESDSEAAELDLGTKIKTPKDVMLEELSLLKNKGSKMFQMRQQRVDMFIVTNENLVSVRVHYVSVCVCVCSKMYPSLLSSSRISRTY